MNALRHTAALYKMFVSELLSRATKVCVHTTVIRPILRYDCETWIVTLRDEHKL